jgi:hypothetical protein
MDQTINYIIDLWVIVFFCNMCATLFLGCAPSPQKITYCGMHHQNNLLVIQCSVHHKLFSKMCASLFWVVLFYKKLLIVVCIIKIFYFWSMHHTTKLLIIVLWIVTKNYLLWNASSKYFTYASMHHAIKLLIVLCFIT